MNPVWRGFGISLGVSLGTPVLLILLALTGSFAMVFAYVLAPQLAYVYPFAAGMKRAPGSGLFITAVELIAFAFAFGHLTRRFGAGVQVLLAVASLGVLWLLGQVFVPLLDLDVSFNVRM
jgi:hypothetical protein